MERKDKQWNTSITRVTFELSEKKDYKTSKCLKNYVTVGDACDTVSEKWVKCIIRYEFEFGFV